MKMNQNNIELGNMDTLSPGSYFLKIKNVNNGTIVVKKLIKK